MLDVGSWFLIVRSIAGEEVLLDDEAVTVGGTNHSHATQDLQEAIAAGEYPEWRLFIQVSPRAMPWGSEMLHLAQPYPTGLAGSGASVTDASRSYKLVA